MAGNNLSAMKVAKLTEAGKYFDGNGLYLSVKPSGAKYWVLRYLYEGKRREMGLGEYDKNSNSLAMARENAADIKKLVKKGIDPIIQASLDKEEQIRKQQQAKFDQEQRNDTTFEKVAKAYIDQKSPEWKNTKHKSQWINTLTKYVYPVIGSISVDDLDVQHVTKCLDPIWTKKTETATRVRQRIEAVISSAIAKGYRDKAKGNPATWKGLLSNFYPAPAKVKRNKHFENGTDGHHAALPYEDIPAFMPRLVALQGFAPMALRLLILTAVRTTELRLARWDEFDLDKKVWTIPAGRMKASIEHRVALSDAAIELLRNTPKVSYTDLVFPGWKKGSPLSDGGLINVLRNSLDIPKSVATVHGFRSTFRDYIGEETSFPERLAEFALSHRLSDEAEAAYSRGDKLKKRYEMMNAWANYCDSKLVKSDKVISIGRRKAG